MAIDPNDINLTPSMREKLAEIAERSGRSWSEVMTEFLEGSASTRKRNPQFGAGKGTAVIAPDFDAPLPDLREYTE